MYSENISISSKNEEISMFDKRTVVELSENQMTNVDGGTSWMFFGTTSLVAVKLN